MKLRKILAGLSCICMLSTMIPVIAQPIETKAQTIELSTTTYETDDLTIKKQGTIDGIDWTIYDNGLLVLTGTLTSYSVPTTGSYWCSYWSNYTSSVTKIYCDFTIGNSNTSLKGLFRELSYLTEVKFGDNFINSVSKASSFSYMFYECTRLENILGLERFDTSNVTNMEYVFAYCPNLKNENFSKVEHWNTGKATTMTAMFNNCKLLKSINLSNWNTSKVKTMEFMFQKCLVLESVNISNWNTENVVSAYNMFVSCYRLKSIDMSDFSLPNATNLSAMFRDCTSLNFIKTPYNISDTCNVSNFFPATRTWYIIEDDEATSTTIGGNNLKGLTESLYLTYDKDYITTTPREYSEDGSSHMRVRANVWSIYTVQIPALVNLSKEGDTNTYSGEYELGCKGIIPDNDEYYSYYVYIQPTSNQYNYPYQEGSDILTFEGQNTGTTVNGAFRQDKINFVNTPVADNEIKIGYEDFATTKGKISAEFTVVDNYTAHLGFNFRLDYKSL